MVSKLGFMAAILTLSALLPIQAQAPKTVDAKPGAVPAAQARFEVFGEVAKPSYYALKPGYRVSDALRLAVLKPNAQLTKVTVVHFDAAHKNATKQTINFKAFLLRGDVKSNPLVASDDMIFVPPRTIKLELQEVINGLKN